MNVNAVEGAAEDSYRFNPWRAPGCAGHRRTAALTASSSAWTDIGPLRSHAPVVDPCGMAGGKGAHQVTRAPSAARTASLAPLKVGLTLQGTRQAIGGDSAFATTPLATMGDKVGPFFPFFPSSLLPFSAAQLVSTAPALPPPPPSERRRAGLGGAQALGEQDPLEGRRLRGGGLGHPLQPRRWLPGRPPPRPSLEDRPRSSPPRAPSPLRAWTSVAPVDGAGLTRGRGGQYRLCPAGRPLTEECMQQTPLEFDQTARPRARTLMDKGPCIAALFSPAATLHAALRRATHSPARRRAPEGWPASSAQHAASHGAAKYGTHLARRQVGTALVWNNGSRYRSAARPAGYTATAGVMRQGGRLPREAPRARQLLNKDLHPRAPVLFLCLRA
jgi:hypothetical protein